MTPHDVRATDRRRFLQYLVASPLFASTALPALAEEAGLKLPDPMIWAPHGLDPIKSPKDAINVFDFEPAAFKNVPPAHFGHMASGIDDEVTLRANREGHVFPQSAALEPCTGEWRDRHSGNARSATRGN